MATIMTKIFEYPNRKETQIMWRCISCNKTMTMPKAFKFSYCGNCGGYVLEKLNIEEEF